MAQKYFNQNKKIRNINFKNVSKFMKLGLANIELLAI